MTTIEARTELSFINIDQSQYRQLLYASMSTTKTKFWKHAFARLEDYERFVPVLHGKKLCGDSDSSLKNNFRPQHKGLRLDSIAPVLIQVLADHDYHTANSKVGYTEDDLAKLFNTIDFQLLINHESKFGAELRDQFNELLAELCVDHPFGSVTFNADWKLLFNGELRNVELSSDTSKNPHGLGKVDPRQIKKLKRSKKGIVAFDLITIAGLTIFLVFFVKRIFPSDAERLAMIEAMRLETKEELQDLYLARKWSELESEANEILDDKELEDIGLFYLGMTQAAKKLSNKSPTYYLFQIDTESEFFEHSFINLLDHYNIKYSGDQITDQMQPVFDHLKSKGHYQSAFWFFLKVKIALEKNRPNDDKRMIDANQAYLDIDNIWSEIQRSLSDVYNFKELKPKFGEGLPLAIEEIDEYNKSFPFERQQKTQALTFYAINTLRRLSSENSLREEWWDIRFKEFMKNNSMESVNNGLLEFNFKIDVNNPMNKEWEKLFEGEDRTWFKTISSESVKNMLNDPSRIKSVESKIIEKDD